MTGSRRGSVIAATWLIGLGTLFLVREAAGWSWGQAWPLFLILVGVASLVSTAAAWASPGPAHHAGGPLSLVGPAAWIGLGVVLLLSTTGTLGTAPGELIAEYWPWLLIAVGGWFLVTALVPDRTARGPAAPGPAAPPTRPGD